MYTRAFRRKSVHCVPLESKAKLYLPTWWRRPTFRRHEDQFNRSLRNRSFNTVKGKKKTIHIKRNSDRWRKKIEVNAEARTGGRGVRGRRGTRTRTRKDSRLRWDYVLDHALSMREAGQPDLSGYTLASIICVFGKKKTSPLFLRC